MWNVDKNLKVDYKYTLRRHLKGVNIVRFSPAIEQSEGAPSQVLLASAGDDCNICIWKYRDTDTIDQQQNDDDDNILQEQDENVERVEWVVSTSLRGHHADVYDLCWSANGAYIVSGSIDNVVLVWDVAKGRSIQEYHSHEKFVRGVAWDPLDEVITSIGCDRTLQIHPLASREKRLRKNRSKKVSQRLVTLKKISLENDECASSLTFHDDNVAIYFSRMTFSPDGNFLFVPSVEISTKANVPAPAAAVFLRNRWHKPWRVLTGFDTPTTSIAVNPKAFKLRYGPQQLMGYSSKIQHRWVFAVTSLSAVLLYDTEQSAPLAFISNLHLAQVTDCRWSGDGSILSVCSTDGYCSFVVFKSSELGQFSDFKLITNCAPSANSFFSESDSPVFSDALDQAHAEEKNTSNPPSECGAGEEIHILQPSKKKRHVQPTLLEIANKTISRIEVKSSSNEHVEIDEDSRSSRSDSETENDRKKIDLHESLESDFEEDYVLQPKKKTHIEPTLLDVTIDSNGTSIINETTANDLIEIEQRSGSRCLDSERSETDPANKDAMEVDREEEPAKAERMESEGHPIEDIISGKITAGVEENEEDRDVMMIE